MRSRASLVLIEQAVMLLVFALAAALCLKAFVWADTESGAMLNRDRALQQAQNAAEILKNSRGDMAAAAELMGGDLSGDGWRVCYDENWQQTEDESAYILVASPREDELLYMAGAEIKVYENERLLTALEIAWQEVDGDEQ